MSFHVQKRSQLEKNKSVNETRQPTMVTEKVIAMLLQLLDENTNNMIHKKYGLSV